MALHFKVSHEGEFIEREGPLGNYGIGPDRHKNQSTTPRVIRLY